MHDKAFDNAKNSTYDGYKRSVAAVVYKVFDKNTSSPTVKKENISNKELSEELHKPIIEKRQVRLPFIDNIWRADFADMKLIIINAFQNLLKESNHKPKKYGQIKVVNFIIDQ